MKLNNGDFKILHFLHPRYHAKMISSKNVQKASASVLMTLYD